MSLFDLWECQLRFGLFSRIFSSPHLRDCLQLRVKVNALQSYMFIFVLETEF